MNPDHTAILEFLSGDGAPLPLTFAPFIKALGTEILGVDVGAGVVTLGFQPGDEFLQGLNVIQGGIVTSMLDFAMAFAGLSRVVEGTHFGTVSMTTNFMRPVTPGRYVCRGRVIRQGARMIFADAELMKAGEDRAVAAASGVMAISSSPSNPPSR
ncbi:MAG: PaaI family thioesterase [Caulobacteraceae bacterium]